MNESYTISNEYCFIEDALKRLYDIFKAWTLPKMNHSDKTITETINDDDQKVDAEKESTRRSRNDFDAKTPGAFTNRAMHRNEYGRVPVSNYVDPRWYDQPDNSFAPGPGDQVSQSTTANTNTSMQQTSSKEPAPDSKRRLGRIFGQI